MPMKEIDFHETGKEIVPKGEQVESVSQKIEDFLRENPEKAWSTLDIANELDLVRATVNQNCIKLATSGKTRRMSVDGTIYNNWNPDYVEDQPGEVGD